ncbi:unnamed protein product [Didymodactylos carnosus]|uniref:Reverse transcriptase domain-containing protein n=1 Tax=Didymodactylos carnosus TaxID=1234261 RepID=A0A815YJV2_9BILA|nr:unnamed protein product [Didymodactylos carnosus]CAF4435525.1 unnamed protein product [Didymodactylos carnosus]
MSITDERAKEAFPALKCVLYDTYSKELPKNLRIRAQCEWKIVQTIQCLLRHRSDIAIRRTDKSKVFYIGKVDDFTRNAEEYMLKIQAYEKLTSGRCPLIDCFNAVQALLDFLVMKNALTQNQRNQLSLKLGNSELGHYHDLSKAHKPGTPLGPIIASMYAPATLLSKFLNDLLAPIFLKVARDTTYINGIDVVRKLETYVANGYVKSTTQFVTADVIDLYIMIPRQGALEALARFCIQHA